MSPSIKFTVQPILQYRASISPSTSTSPLDCPQADLLPTTAVITSTCAIHLKSYRQPESVLNIGFLNWITLQYNIGRSVSSPLNIILVSDLPPPSNKLLQRGGYLLSFRHQLHRECADKISAALSDLRLNSIRCIQVSVEWFSFCLRVLYESKSAPLFRVKRCILQQRLSPHSYPAFRLRLFLVLVNNSASMRVLLRTCYQLHAVGPMFRFLHFL